MSDGARTLLSPLRIKIPFLVDLVVVSDPDQIRKVEATGDVDRLHVFDTASLALVGPVLLPGDEVPRR